LSLGGASVGQRIDHVARAGANSPPSITEGNVAPIPMAIPNFIAGTPSDGESAARHDAGHHQQSAPFGLFQPIYPAAYIEKITKFRHPARFPDWRPDQRARARHGPHHAPRRRPAARRIPAVDVFAEQPDSPRSSTSRRPTTGGRIAHIISDNIYERADGEKGYFDTRIVFIDETGGKEPAAVKRLAIMDQDGANVRYLTRAKTLC